MANSTSVISGSTARFIALSLGYSGKARLIRRETSQVRSHAISTREDLVLGFQPVWPYSDIHHQGNSKLHHILHMLTHQLGQRFNLFGWGFEHQFVVDLQKH